MELARRGTAARNLARYPAAMSGNAQVPVPGCELRRAEAVLLGVQVGLMQVRTQQHQQRAVPVGEVRAGPAEQEQAHAPARAGVTQRGGRTLQKPQGPRSCH